MRYGIPLPTGENTGKNRIGIDFIANISTYIKYLRTA
jgi:hypothetical protein